MEGIYGGRGKRLRGGNEGNDLVCLPQPESVYAYERWGVDRGEKNEKKKR